MNAILLKKNKRSQGFTLLEVMIALGIMTMAFAAILSSESNSILLTVKMKDMNMAGWLAQKTMVESEHLMEGKPFSDLKTEETKDFDAPFEKFKWKRELKEIKFPDLVSDQKKEGDGTPEPVRLLLKSLTKYINDSTRELVITITWKRGEGEQRLVLATYLIDLSKDFTLTQ